MAMTTPLVVSAYVQDTALAIILSFLSIFALNALDEVATEIEEPFGHDANDLPLSKLHQEFNERLLQLQRKPRLMRSPDFAGGEGWRRHYNRSYDMMQLHYKQSCGLQTHHEHGDAGLQFYTQDAHQPGPSVLPAAFPTAQPTRHSPAGRNSPGTRSGTQMWASRTGEAQSPVPTVTPAEVRMFR
mmetsp:Transcript_13425/g.28955  ORF Transcript_13425/g.28955 Transcript_13425/m.28955 type:complete len:185 (+) Transcript_13425:1-555(+)